MSVSSGSRRPPDLDLERAQAAWLRGLPARLPKDLLSARDVARLLEAAEHYLRSGSTEALAALDGEGYRVAAELELRLGHEATLRCVRDGMARSLAAWLETDPGILEPVLHVLSRVTDAVWQAHTDTLRETIRVQQREALSRELLLAKRIQERLLPRTVPVIPGFDIAGRVLPAAEVGGDYWSCKNYPEDDIVTFKLADVTGHGIAAATLVAAVKFISGGYYRGSKTAAEVMKRTNHVLVKETPHEILVTMVYGWLYPHSSEMSVVNAGHSPVLHHGRGEFHVIEPTGIALGMMETQYTECRVSMEPGDLFVTCSDGVTEPSVDASLGEAWFRGQVEASRDLSAGEMVDRILEEALRFYRAPLDDMSIVVIKRV